MENETVQHNPVNESPKYNPISVGEGVITTIILGHSNCWIYYVICLGFWQQYPAK